MPKPTILIADANENIRRFLQRELTSEGFDVIPAQTHIQIFQALRRQPPPDLIVMDPEIPFIGGIPTLCRLLALAPLTPVLLYTAYAEDAEHPVYCRADAIVEKVPDPAFLMETIKRLLKRSKMAVAAAGDEPVEPVSRGGPDEY